MKYKLSIASALFFLCTTVKSQDSIQYQLCNQDFRPLNLRQRLPANAVYTNTKASAEARAKDVISRLTFEEKLVLTGGWKRMHFPAVERLGLRPVAFSDASQGIRIQKDCIPMEKTTSFPSTIALAATWNTQLAYAYAKSIGEECKAWGISVLLGPGMNIYRNAAGGRNYEYLGEDPMLTSRLSVAYVKGLQETGTMATIKHFIGNEQELARHIVNVKIDDRALREIYLPPFEASIKEANALAVMTGNNQVNGFPGAANTPLSNDVLRKDYGFKGMIMSDWANSIYWPGRHNLELTSGHSLLMSNNELFATYIKNEIQEHPGQKAAIEKELETMVFYNLYPLFKAGMYDRPYRDPGLVSKFDEHKKVALTTAEEAITLLKNDNHLLPIKPATVNKIVVLGNDDALRVYSGTGSGKVQGYDHVDYITRLRNVYGSKLVYNKNINDAEIRSADVVLYFITKPAGEGGDVDFNLPLVQDSITRYAALNTNLVVIFSGGNGFAMPWLSQVKALVFAYFLGQTRGEALANIISGKVNPSGKLPFTIEKSFDDGPAKDFNKMKDSKYYWGGDRKDSREMEKQFGEVNITYNEGIYVGYRWYEKKKIAPQFPFGFGLSYTSFSISDITSSSKKINKDKPVTISCMLKNTGNTAGAEVVQLYVRDVESSVDRPLKELKAFQKVFLQAGESKRVTMQLNWKDLAFWDVKGKTWKAEPGTFTIEVGSSSQDIKQSTSITFE
jgi:beta-glucosidase